MIGYHNYDKYPALSVPGYEAWEGYKAVAARLKKAISDA